MGRNHLKEAKTILNDIKSNKDFQTTLGFKISKTHRKEISKRPQFFAF